MYRKKRRMAAPSITMPTASHPAGTTFFLLLFFLLLLFSASWHPLFAPISITPCRTHILDVTFKSHINSDFTPELDQGTEV